MKQYLKSHINSDVIGTCENGQNDADPYLAARSEAKKGICLSKHLHLCQASLLPTCKDTEAERRCAGGKADVLTETFAVTTSTAWLKNLLTVGELIQQFKKISITSPKNINYTSID